ncbi:N-acetylated-alpha-linked acidic dipeptidase-like protein 2 [Lophium mytilinum]|uniref:N-acetylated-alpha-linked acidic dipeptidase-like protein 2 n=1 Tax=Lophium mytilinum TaxID=390894 RepID=A0A6A6R2F6_9PEZI|nr:N-acetylated-alpha-linked acidic dipeptidase-like protein 2 [Lophium mytilinum]
MKLPLILVSAIGVQACLRERDFGKAHNHKKLVKRQDVVPFPPVLDANEKLLVDSFDNATIATWEYYYSHGAHLAGTNKTQAQWTADRWAEFGFTSSLAEYFVFLDYPIAQSLRLDYSNGTSHDASLEEEVLAVDDTTSYPNRIPVFNGYSFSGNATAEYVYVGRGQEVDFVRLKELGVELEGKIALTKYGGPFRGLKVKNAQNHGMIGAIIFTDPGSDGNITEANGYKAYPDGPARNPTSVQRGTVEFLSTYAGDPTTPGYPSKFGSPRSDRFVVTPRIPSIPISWLDAQPLLQALDGHGFTGEEVNRTGWLGGIGNVTYSTGPAPGTTLFLENEMEEKYTYIWNAIGIINGTNEDEVVIVGNHRDAWIVGGAGDPNSGSAVIIELSKAFGKLLATGWKPARTIILASWDGEEYGTVGSTEWVEEYVPWLTEAAVTNINVDIATSGPYPYIDATPDLHAIATTIMKKIIYPVKGVTNRTFYDVWYDFLDGEFGVLGSGSDFATFLHKGISAIDFGANGGPEDPIWHYHSNFDSYHWMSTLGDPGFVTHRSIGQFLALLLYHLVNDDVLPLTPADYTPALEEYFSDLKETVAEANSTVNLSELSDAIATFKNYSSQFEELRAFAVSSSDSDLIKVTNTKAKDFSRGFVSQGGLPEREFYQHLIFAPGIDTGYAPVTFPAVTEAVEAGDLELAQKWVGKTAKAILVAADVLKT